MRCKKLDELAVVGEWQDTVVEPDCKHYDCGRCRNPGRLLPECRCPFDGREMPVREVKEPA